MKNIKNQAIAKKARELIVKANFEIPSDILDKLKASYRKESSENARTALKMMLDNAEIAKKKMLPLCQDCGNVYISIGIGEGYGIEDVFALKKALHLVIAEEYTGNSLRPSIVDDPLYDRKNTGDNSPGIIEIEGFSGKGISLSVYLKGGGSENCSYLLMQNPGISEQDLMQDIYDIITKDVTKCCPPVIIGIGIGSSASHVIKLARKASFRRLDMQNKDTRYATLEDRILEKINSSGIGVQGLGGSTTALACNIEHAPCHMATLPVGISLGCHSTRRASAVIC